MNDHSEAEFRRIMSNPPNEIISDSLKGRLKLGNEKTSNVSLLIGEEEHDCSLEGFSFGKSLSKVETITLSLREDLVGRILSNKSFELKSTIAEQLNLDFDQISEIQCFRHEEDSYILELSVGEKSDD